MGVAFLMLNSSNSNYSVDGYSFEVSSIDRELDEFVNFCVENASKFAAVENFKLGGYYDNSYEQIILDTDKYAIYVKLEAENISPTLVVLQEEFEDSIKNNFLNCLNDFSIFTNAGFIVDSGEAKFDISFLELTTEIDLNFPVTISKDSTSFNFDTFSYSLDLPLAKMYSNTQSFIEIHEGNFTSIPMSSLIFLSNEEDFRFEVMDLDDETSMLFSFIYDVEELIVSYDFVIQYDWEVIEE